MLADCKNLFALIHSIWQGDQNKFCGHTVFPKILQYPQFNEYKHNLNL